eukprot:TRINITY_DN5582_c0_g1_i3.p1 TRINITY_DN5582_c0_g1~~TRINITY_DN5582_c0_g1_i3.p1  ORF type:complete len:370 (+),score=71.12 TRINITY_DN5582_c0_g1_i3:80-1111(+)
MAALLRAAGALPEPGGGPMGVAKGAPGGMAVYVMHGETTTQVEVTAEATVGDVAAGLAEILGRDVGPLSFQGVPLQNDRMLADEGIGAEAVMNECPRHEAKFHPEVKGDHIEISNDGKTAERTQSFMKAIVCTSVPIASSAEAACSAAQPVGFEIVVDEWSDRGWAGSLKAGIFPLEPQGHSLEEHTQQDKFSRSGLSAIKHCMDCHLDERGTAKGFHVRVLLIPSGHVVAQSWHPERPEEVYVAYAGHILLKDSPGLARKPLHGVIELYGKCSKATILAQSPGPLQLSGNGIPPVPGPPTPPTPPASGPGPSTAGPRPQQAAERGGHGEGSGGKEKRRCSVM